MSEPLHDRVVIDTGRDRRVVARQSAGNVFDRFTHVETDFVAPHRQRMATQLHDGHFGRIARARRLLFEHKRHALTRQRARPRGPLR